MAHESSPNTIVPAGPWWRGLNRYHWFVLIVAALGWLLDCMDQQLFNIARRPAMVDLLKPGQSVSEFSGYATAIFLIGWATGGLTFGVLGDRIGRARTMMWTILIYSLFTGLSALSTGFWDFALYRFLTGLGVGGEFAVGVALVAEVMPARARPYALGLLQALSVVGNLSAAMISMGFGQLQLGNAWRWMFVIGTFPALLAVVVRMRLKEPEKWQAAAAQKERKKLGSYAELFGNPKWLPPAIAGYGCILAIMFMAFLGPASWPKLGIGIGLALAALALGLWSVFGGKGSPWRRNALTGLLLAFSGVVGLWGIGFFSIDLIRSVMEKQLVARGLSGTELSGALNYWAGVTSVCMNVGAFFGIYGFSVVSQRIGRKPTFAISFVLALVSTVLVFAFVNTFVEVLILVPLMGLCQLSLFGGYAVYFPELFPTHLRSTGTSFCYNVGRFIAASGPAVLGLLTGRVYNGMEEPMRWAGITMCAVFLIGLMVLPFAPETKDKPLPEDEAGFAH